MLHQTTNVNLWCFKHISYDYDNPERYAYKICNNINVLFYFGPMCKYKVKRYSASFIICVRKIKMILKC